MKALLLFVTLAVVAYSQSFEAASIHPSANSPTTREGYAREKIDASPGSLVMTNTLLSSAIRWAWNIRDYQILNAPDWLNSTTWDISARAPQSASPEAMRPMLQALLQTRFHLAVHHETRDLALYELTIAKGGPKLAKSAAEAKPDMHPRGGSLVFRNFTMPDLAAALARRPIRVDRPVTDHTGLQGQYDFALNVSPDPDSLKSALEAMDSGTGDTLFNYLEHQLGLKLQSRKGPVDVVVIDRIDKTPTSN